MMRRLLSPSGRHGRRPFVTTLLVVVACVAGGAFLLFAAFANVAATAVDPTLSTVALWLAVALLAWIAIVAAVRRLHDRDRSGWWLLPFVALPWGLLGLGTVDRHGPGDLIATVVATALALWGAAEMVVLAGTHGANRFGPDPLAPADRPAEVPPAHRPSSEA